MKYIMIIDELLKLGATDWFITSRTCRALFNGTWKTLHEMPTIKEMMKSALS